MGGAIRSALLCLTTAVLVMAVSSPVARAAVIITALQSGGDVVISATGTLDLSGMHLNHSGADVADVDPSSAAIVMGPPPSPIADDVYEGLTGPASFGPGGASMPSSGGGDIFGVNGSFNLLGVPAHYISGASLSAIDTYANQTLASLGMTPGAYVFTLPSSDTLTVQIGPIPEPAGLSLLAAVAWIAAVGPRTPRRRLNSEC